MPKRSNPKPTTSTSPATRRTQLVYGSLYLDAGETLESAKQQVDAVLQQAGLPFAVLVLGFDIVATPAQIQAGLAQALGRHLLDYIDERHPGLARVLGITDDDHRRVIRDMLFSQRLRAEDLDNVHLIEME